MSQKYEVLMILEGTYPFNSGGVSTWAHMLCNKVKNAEFILYSIYCYKRVFKIIKTDKQFFYPSSYKRFNFLKQFSENKKVKTDFIFREKYRAGIKSEAEKIKTSKEFSENMLQNPYTFCLRGAGNFSVRLYETLAMGRIPVVIKTDFRLPLQSFIYWEKHCVLLNQDNFVTDFIDFHNQITSSDFELMQINNLKLWNEFLNRESYFKQISAIFESKILNHD